MFQFLSPSLCRFSSGSCRPLIAESVPDAQILQLFLGVQECRDTATRGTCNSDPRCLWLDVCIPDFTALAAACFDRGYLSLHRAFQCRNLPTEAKCEGLPGCKWDDIFCLEDEIEVNNVVANDSAIIQAIIEDQECRVQEDCTGDCKIDNLGDCTARSLDPFHFITSARPWCNFWRKHLECNDTPLSECSGVCQASLFGDCFYPIEQQDFIDIAYASDPDLQRQMTTALEECPSITNAADCLAFSA